MTQTNNWKFGVWAQGMLQLATPRKSKKIIDLRPRVLAGVLFY